MNKRITNWLNIIGLSFIVINFVACSKSDPSPTPATDVCAGKTIVITATTSANQACTSDGTIDVTATGSTNFLYKLKSTGTYQDSATFTNVTAGDYTVFAKDGDGCEKSVTVTVANSGSAGPLFTSMKNLVAARCQSCHNNTIANGGMNFQVECNIVVNKDLIKQKAVVEGVMPLGNPLPQAEKDIISNWINAGGKYTN